MMLVVPLSSLTPSVARIVPKTRSCHSSHMTQVNLMVQITGTMQLQLVVEIIKVLSRSTIEMAYLSVIVHLRYTDWRPFHHQSNNKMTDIQSNIYQNIVTETNHQSQVGHYMANIFYIIIISIGDPQMSELYNENFKRTVTLTLI